jgi:hypothetical protein
MPWAPARGSEKQEILKNLLLFFLQKTQPRMATMHCHAGLCLGV